MFIDLSSGLSISFKPQDAQELEHARPSQLAKIEISPSGLGLHFPALDADIYLPGCWKASLVPVAGWQRSLAKREVA